jgi:Fe-S-cluster containining protein
VDPENILKKAKKSISSFCIEECRSYCCRKGYLVLTKNELDLITGNDSQKRKDLISALDDGRFSLFIGNSLYPCPALLPDFRCRIHKNRNRPRACREFPAFLKGDTVYFSNRCLAVRQGLFYPYIYRLRSMGLKIMFSDPIAEVFNSNSSIEKDDNQDKAAKLSDSQKPIAQA